MKRLSKLRQFRDNVDPLKYMTGEHRQNLLAIEESFRQLEAKNYKISKLCESFTSTLNSADPITNLSVNIVATGGPITIGLQEVYASSDAGISSASNCKVIITRTKLNGEATDIAVRPVVGSASVQSVAFTFLDVVDSGQYTYQAKLISTNATVTNLKLFALENK